MAKFEKDEAAKTAAKTINNEAVSLNINLKDLQHSTDASVSFADGDKVTVLGGLATLKHLPQDMIVAAQTRLKDNTKQVTKGYYVFNCQVTRGDKTFPAFVSVKQFYTPTYWSTATAVEGKIVNRDGADTDDTEKGIQIYQAPFRGGQYRFGYQGVVKTLEGVPYLDDDVTIEMKKLPTAYTAQFASFGEGEREQSLEKGATTLRQRDNYVVAL